MPEIRHVVVAGASGLIGRALVASLRARSVQVTTLVRRPARTKHEREWLTSARPLDPTVLEGADAVVGLNGASVGHLPWTPGYKSTLLWSRLTPTRTLATAIRALGEGAPAFINASTTGIYGNAPGATLTETSPTDTQFPADLVTAWEAAANAAGDHTRVAMLRTALVVHPDAVLKPLILTTRLGLGGPFGRGNQVWPWISLVDEVAAIRHVLEHDISGPVNLASPTRTTANDLGFALATRMNRPYLLRAPEWTLRTALGKEAAEALLLNDMDVVPEVLQSTGFTFTHERIEDAIAAVVPDGRP